MRYGFAAAVACVCILALSALPASAGNDEPDVIVVQHILIGVKGKVPDKKVERSKKEAAALAEDIFERAQAGEDFDAMVKEYTDDRYPGFIRVTNEGAPTRADATPRNGLVMGFGDVAFRLEVGEYGLVKYSYRSSPYGWHVIKRLE